MPTPATRPAPAPAELPFAMRIERILADCREMILNGQGDKAEPILRKAIEESSIPPLWAMLAQSHRHRGQLDEARKIQEMLVGHQPGNYVFRFDLAETALLQGDFNRGWQEYHYRYSLPHTVRIERKVQRPRWDGSPLGDQRILVHDEQGFGDTFQFMRLVPRVKERGGHVILEINPESKMFAERMGGYDELIIRGEVPPAFDLHCEMMSLPRALGLQWGDVPGPVMPYLKPNPELVAKWRERLKDLPRPLVCIVWAGRPTHMNDRFRSMALADMAPLGASGATFLSVQKGDRAADAHTPPAGMRIEVLSDEISTFDDTAAIFMVADLLISIDSSPVHLAGGLGRPAWVLIPQLPDWRWLTQRTDTPWYPTHKLYRQGERPEWGPVIHKVARDLRRFVAKNKLARGQGGL